MSSQSLDEARRALEQQRRQLAAAEQEFKKQYDAAERWVEEQLKRARTLLAQTEKELASLPSAGGTPEVRLRRLELQQGLDKARTDLIETEAELRAPLEEATRAINRIE